MMFQKNEIIKLLPMLNSTILHVTFYYKYEIKRENSFFISIEK